MLPGVSWAHGAGWWTPTPRPIVDYTVHAPEHWVFDGTGLTQGDLFGASVTIVAYETDAAELTTNDGGHPAVAGGDGTPAGFRVLASADLFDWAPSGFCRRGRQSWTMYDGHLYQRRDRIFRRHDRLAALSDPIVAQITRNVLERLSSLDPPSVPSPPTPTEIAWDRSH